MEKKGILILKILSIIFVPGALTVFLGTHLLKKFKFINLKLSNNYTVIN